MDDIRKIVAEHLRPDDPERTADDVLESLNVPARWARMFRTLVVAEASTQSRNFVRSVERSHGASETETGLAATADRTKYLSQRFYTGTGYVTWGTATVDDHQARIDFQTVLRSGIQADIDRHAEAINQITAGGVTCLAELLEVAS